MILVSYDGSPDAQAAIDHAAKLMPGAEAIILTVWEPFFDTLARSAEFGLGVTGTYADAETVDAATRDAALATATEGAERARAAGLSAQPQCTDARGGIPDAILATAANVDADAIVIGTRGRSPMRSALLGSVSHAVVHHADRAVLVIPSPAVAARRHRHETAEGATA